MSLLKRPNTLIYPSIVAVVYNKGLYSGVNAIYPLLPTDPPNAPVTFGCSNTYGLNKYHSTQ